MAIRGRGVYIPPWVGTRQITVGKAGGTIPFIVSRSCLICNDFVLVKMGKSSARSLLSVYAPMCYGVQVTSQENMPLPEKRWHNRFKSSPNRG